MADQIEALKTALAGRYDVDRELGRGGMATVYLATDVKHERKVALKVLRPELAAMVGPERFLREIKTTAQLSNPHILPLLDSGEAPGTLFYVMPYVEGESLRDRMVREKLLPLDDAISIARDVANALNYAHSRGIIHRDIKPENILLSGGTAVVADFGIAKALVSGGSQQLTETGLAIGTPAYMSPEQSLGGEVLDGRSDIYALGCVTYEMLTGEAPYTGPTAQAIIFKRLKEPVPHVSTLRQVPVSVEYAVTKALARESVDRWATAAEFATALKSETTPMPIVTAKPKALGSTLTRVLAGGGVLVALSIIKLFSGSGDKAPAAPALPPAGMVLVPGRTYPLFGGQCPLCLAGHTVRLDSFYVDKTEVTVGAYAAFVAAGRAKQPWVNRPADTFPVTGVMELEAAAYCRSRDSLTTLPSEVQWEAAGRGADGRTYPWGQPWVAANANAAGIHGSIIAVGTHQNGASPSGALDMSGNVWEWTSTQLKRNGQTSFIIRGGAYNSPPEAVTVFYRAAAPVVAESLRQVSYDKTGFRCVRALR